MWVCVCVCVCGGCVCVVGVYLCVCDLKYLRYAYCAYGSTIYAWQPFTVVWEIFD